MMVCMPFLSIFADRQEMQREQRRSSAGIRPSDLWLYGIHLRPLGHGYAPKLLSFWLSGVVLNYNITCLQTQFAIFSFITQNRAWHYRKIWRFSPAMNISQSNSITFSICNLSYFHSFFPDSLRSPQKTWNSLSRVILICSLRGKKKLSSVPLSTLAFKPFRPLLSQLSIL